MTDDKPPLPPFTRDTAAQKLQAAEDAWNTCDAERVAQAYTTDSVWRNRDAYVTAIGGRTAAEPALSLIPSYLPAAHQADPAGAGTLGDAARALGVSPDTLRRWERAGKLRTTRDEANRRRVPKREVERLSERPDRHKAGSSLSARNRFPGVVVSVEVDGVMALVEIEAGPHRITAAITRDAVEELGLVEGARATAAVKATSVTNMPP